MTLHENGHIQAALLNSQTTNFERFWHVIRRYLGRVLSLTVLVTIFVMLFVLTLTPQYQTTATVLIEPKQAKVVSTQEENGVDPRHEAFFYTQYEVLKSQQIAEGVVEKLNLHKNPTFDPEYASDKLGFLNRWVLSIKTSVIGLLPFLPQNDVSTKSQEIILASKNSFAVQKMMQALQINPIKNTQLLEITYEHEDPTMAASIANTVAEVYIESLLQPKNKKSANASTWINDSLQGLKTELAAAEKKLADFYHKERLANIEHTLGLASEKLQQLSKQLLNAQTNLKKLETINLQVNSATTTISDLYNLPEVINHPAVQSVKRSIVDSESKISELSKVFGPKHPKMIAANAELDSVRLSLNKQIRSVVSSINTQYLTAQATLKYAQNEFEKANEDFIRLSTLENQRNALQRDVEANKQLYASFFIRLEETKELDGFETANARIFDKARIPNIAVKPQKIRIIALTFMSCFAFGLFLAFLLDALNSVISSGADVERKLGQLMLGTIPWQPHLPLRHYFDIEQQAFSESVRTLRTNMQSLKIDKPAKTILVTSSIPKEGKSTVAINLAFAMGQLNNVLLIDTDLRRPSIAKYFELLSTQPGISDLISGSHSLEECIVSDESSGVDILSAGTAAANPQELLASEKFTVLMKRLEDRYEHIIVDSAPIQAVSDAIIVSKRCDSVIYVVQAYSTNHKLINHGLNQFLLMGHRVDGIVLNQVDLNKANKTEQYLGYYAQNLNQDEGSEYSDNTAGNNTEYKNT